jgi:hypothetical protein
VDGPAKIDEVVLTDPVVPELAQPGVMLVAVDLDRVSELGIREVDAANELTEPVKHCVLCDRFRDAIDPQERRHPALEHRPSRNISSLFQQPTDRADTSTSLARDRAHCGANFRQGCELATRRSIQRTADRAEGQHRTQVDQCPSRTCHWDPVDPHDPTVVQICESMHHDTLQGRRAVASN